MAAPARIRRSLWLALAVFVLTASLGGVAIAFSIALSSHDVPVESLPSSSARTPLHSVPREVVEPPPYVDEITNAVEPEPVIVDEADEEPRSSPSPSSRRRRRGPSSRRGARPDESSGEAPVLLDVNAFDQQSR